MAYYDKRGNQPAAAARESAAELRVGRALPTLDPRNRHTTHYASTSSGLAAATVRGAFRKRFMAGAATSDVAKAITTSAT